MPYYTVFLADIDILILSLVTAAPDTFVINAVQLELPFKNVTHKPVPPHVESFNRILPVTPYDVDEGKNGKLIDID